MTAIAARAEVDAAQTLRLSVPCDLPPGPVDVVVQVPSPNRDDGLPPDLASAVDPRKPRRLGTLKGSVLFIAPDFDAIPEGFEDYVS